MVIFYGFCVCRGLFVYSGCLVCRGLFVYCDVYLPWFVSVLWCASFLRLFAVVCFGNVVAVVCLFIMSSLFAVVCFFQGGVSAYHGLLVL